MSEALVKSSVFKIGKESTYGTAATTSAIELSGVPTFSDSYDTVERNIIRQAFSSYAPIRGTEQVSGSLQVEANYGVRHTKLYQGAFGYWHSVDISEADAQWSTNPTGTSLTLTNSTEFTDPQMTTGSLPVDDTSGFYEGYPFAIYDSLGHVMKLAGFITNVDSGSDTLTILTSHPAGTVTITTSDLVGCGQMFTLCDENQEQVASLPSYTIEYFRGNITKEQYLGCIFNKFSIDMSTGQLIQPSFDWDGKTVTYSSGTDSSTPVSGNNPLVMRLSDVFMKGSDDSIYQRCISNIQLELTNDLFKKECVATSGVGKVIRTGRKVTGSLNTFYENKDLQTAFKDGVTYSLYILVGYSTGSSTSGHTQPSTILPGYALAISIPKLKFSEVGVDEDTGIFKYNTSFTCEPVNGDDEIVLAWL